MADEVFKPEEKVEVVGKKYIAEISAKGNSSSIKEEGGKEAAYEILGEETFFELCDIKIGDLRKYIPEGLLDEKVLVTERTGARTVKLK